MRKADETIANILRYGGYVTFNKGISRQLQINVGLLNSAFPEAQHDVFQPELLADLRSQLPSAVAALDAKMAALQTFKELHAHTRFETFFVLQQLYDVMVHASHERVTSLNRVISALSQPNTKPS